MCSLTHDAKRRLWHVPEECGIYKAVTFACETLCQRLQTANFLRLAYSSARLSQTGTESTCAKSGTSISVGISMYSEDCIYCTNEWSEEARTQCIAQKKQRECRTLCPTNYAEQLSAEAPWQSPVTQVWRLSLRLAPKCSVPGRSPAQVHQQ